MLQATLDEDSIARVRKALEAYSARLGDALDRTARSLLDEGAEMARWMVPVDTGELSGSIGSRTVAPGEHVLEADCPHAAFVEFGTGVVGSGTYPSEVPGYWEYDARRTPAAHDPADPEAWYYRGDDGRVRRTKGRAASGYMAAAADVMRQHAVPALRRELSR